MPDRGRNPYPPYRGKRAVDLVLLAIVAIPAAVIGAVCAVAVRLTSRGPVFFRQERIGMDGVPFLVWKFRTMVAGDNPIFPDATRITSAGRWLRRLSLDELPQLINVARGEMSIVGPRPTLAYQVERYDEHQRLRLCVRPGLTGLAQISGRNALGWGERIEHDIRYVQTQSLRTDLRILAGTARVVLSGEGAEGHPTDDPLAVTDEIAGPADDAAERPAPADGDETGTRAP
jgi:lipopolysaccharide/colanic/teichoic acid biosynthesis glycosyltransferase